MRTVNLVTGLILGPSVLLSSVLIQFEVPFSLKCLST